MTSAGGHLVYIWTHSGHIDLCGSTHPRAIYAGPQVEAHQCRKLNLVGVVFSIVSGQNYGHRAIYIPGTDIYIYIHTIYI